MKRAHRSSARRQRGLVTLIVVMVLFFIVSLVAAYANRNLIFEQRTSSNQYRATQALEAADAGLEWALAMLNYGRITSTCQRSTDASDTSFRQRYINTDTTTGKLTPTNPDLRPSCVFNGTGWDCSCPGSGNPSLTPPTGSDIFPAFRVRFQYMNPANTLPPGQPGVIKVQAVGCTRLDTDCLLFDGPSSTNEGRAIVSSLVALTGNIASPPQAPVIAHGVVNPGGGAAWTFVNSDPAGNGITVHAGGAINNPATMTLRGMAGTPGPETVIRDDTALRPPTVSTFDETDRRFAISFNMVPATFQLQPAAVTITCSGLSPCSAVAVRDAIALNPGRPIWVDGNLDVDSTGDIGSSAEPVLLVVKGNLAFPTSDVTIHGLVYVRTTVPWSTSGSGKIQGAVIAQDGIDGNGALTVVYDAALLQRLKSTAGSIVRVPGSWKDFR